MTLDEAVKAIIEETKEYKWENQEDDHLRCYIQHEPGQLWYCPITALLWKSKGWSYSTGAYHLAASEMGFVAGAASIIADAADNHLNTPERKQVRERLVNGLLRKVAT